MLTCDEVDVPSASQGATTLLAARLNLKEECAGSYGEPRKDASNLLMGFHRISKYRITPTPSGVNTSKTWLISHV